MTADDRCPWHSAHGVAAVRTISTQELISTCTPGNRPPPWSWEDEAAYVDEQTCCCEHCGCDGNDPGWYQRHIESLVANAGQWIGQPAMLGDDQIVRDGHHRIIAAWRVGVPTVDVVRAIWPLWWQDRSPR